MPQPTNRPTVDRLQRQLYALPGMATVDAIRDQLLGELLDASIAWVEEQAATFFDGRALHEVRDGNGTSGMHLFVRPVTSVSLVKVELPVLALTRTYTASEVKVYRRQGHLTIFTYKLAAEHATLHLDQQVYANIFPALPQCVQIDYTGGYPVFDVAAGKTSLDGVTWLAGDLRDPREVNRVTQLAQAAICDAAASFLAQAAGLGVGLITAVSFDGFSKSMNPQAYGPQVQALVERRDQLIGRAKGIGMVLASL